jgi:hypothetical protein
MAKMKKELVVFNTKKMHKGAKEDAQRWNDAAPMMSSVNAKKPMVVEQMPSGAIMGRGTSAKPMSSRGAGTRKAQGAYTNPKGMDSVPVVKRAKKAAPCPECGMEKTMCRCGGMGKMAKRAKGGSDDGGNKKMTPAELKRMKAFDPNLYDDYMYMQGNGGEEKMSKSARGSLRKEMPPRTPRPSPFGNAPMPARDPSMRPMKPTMPMKPTPVRPNNPNPIMRPMLASPMGKVSKRKNGK